MSITEQIEQDITSAMKAREQEKLDALRMVRAALKNEVIALGHELSESEEQKVLNRLMKQRTDAATQYGAAGRTEMADKETREAELLKAYLPEQMTEADLEVVVQKAITDTGATSVADTGKVIGAVMREVAGKASGDQVSALVKKHLAQ